MLSEQEYNEKLLGHIAKIAESVSEATLLIVELVAAIRNRQRVLNLPTPEHVAAAILEKGKFTATYKPYFTDEE